MSCASHKPQIGWTVLKEVITFSVASGRGFAVEHQDLFGKDASPVNGPTLTRWPPRFPLRRRESIGRGVQVVSTGDEETAPGRPGSTSRREHFSQPPLSPIISTLGPPADPFKHASPRLSATPTEPIFSFLFLSERSSVSGRAGLTARSSGPSSRGSRGRRARRERTTSGRCSGTRAGDRGGEGAEHGGRSKGGRVVERCGVYIMRRRVSRACDERLKGGRRKGPLVGSAIDSEGEILASLPSFCFPKASTRPDANERKKSLNLPKLGKCGESDANV